MERVWAGYIRKFPMCPDVIDPSQMGFIQKKEQVSFSPLVRPAICPPFPLNEGGSRLTPNHPVPIPSFDNGGEFFSFAMSTYLLEIQRDYSLSSCLHTSNRMGLWRESTNICSLWQGHFKFIFLSPFSYGDTPSLMPHFWSISYLLSLPKTYLLMSFWRVWHPNLTNWRPLATYVMQPTTPLLPKEPKTTPDIPPIAQDNDYMADPPNLSNYILDSYDSTTFTQSDEKTSIAKPLRNIETTLWRATRPKKFYKTKGLLFLLCHKHWKL